MTGSAPDEHGLPGRLWNVQKIRAVVATVFLVTCARSTLWNYLTRIGLAWLKTKKLLAKARTARRATYLDLLRELYRDMVAGRRTLVYVDEAHIHQDLDAGYGWAPKGERFCIPSTSPGLSAKINWYGAYDFTNGRAFLWSYAKCTGEATVDFLKRIVSWSADLPRVTVIWDGASVHRAKIARAEATRLGLEVVFLPGYSPDLNPIEGLWKWLRESVTQGFCHPTLRSLFDSTLAFITTINRDPEAMISRLWPKFDLVPAEEKLRVSI